MVYRDMMTITPSALSDLSDTELVARLQAATRAERQATAHLISLLMELDTRRLYLGEGFSSLFTYCTQALHLSEHAAYNRIEAARAARRFPIILEFIGEDAVTLTAIRLLAPHLTPHNHRDVLTQARRKSKREIEQLVAALHPQPDVPATIRKLPTPTTVGMPAATPADTTSSANKEATMVVLLPRNMRAAAAVELKPLAPERYKIQFTIGREGYEKFRRAQDLLRHVVPNGDPAIVFERALTWLVAELERRKTATAARPRAARAAKPASRHIPSAIKRAVWQRDGGRCAFEGRQGRCTETGFLEYHHVVPFAAGGEATVPNIELRCRSHNSYEADQHLGLAEVPLLRERPVVYEPELVPERALQCIDQLARRPPGLARASPS
jgi:5-methylcytosine-specific restriction endonuclease McrA